MKKRAILFLTCLVLASCGKVQNTLVVANNSGVTANQVNVTVCGKAYVFKDIKNGDSATQTFSINGDSGFTVVASLSDATTVTGSFGYVTGGAGAYGNRTEIQITKSRLIVGKQK